MADFALGIYRETSLAGKPEADTAILDATAQNLQELGYEVKTIHPQEFNFSYSPQVIFTMARGGDICARLSLFVHRATIINSPKAIQDTLNRWKAYYLATAKGVTLPSTKIVPLTEFPVDKKYILKRPDRHEFTTVVSTQEELKKAIESYKQQNIDRIIKQEYIEGKHIKYYGIGNNVYLADNAEVTETPQIVKKIKEQAIRAANAIGLLVYGGDVLVKGNEVYLVDINDWPSFSSMREIAAREIAKLIDDEYKKRNR